MLLILLRSIPVFKIHLKTLSTVASNIVYLLALRLLWPQEICDSQLWFHQNLQDALPFF